MTDEADKVTSYSLTCHLTKQCQQMYVAKRFLDFLDKHFPPNNWLLKMFNTNTVKVSYSCTPNMGSIIKSHKKKLTNAENKQTKNCNCTEKEECSLEGKCRFNDIKYKCRLEDIIYKCVVTATSHPQKVYLGTAEGDFKQQYYKCVVTATGHPQKVYLGAAEGDFKQQYYDQK